MRLTRVFHSATFRLAGLYLLLFVFSVSAFVLLLFFQMQKVLESEARNQITTEVNLLLFEYREDGIEELLEEIEERIEKNLIRDRFVYTVQNSAGRVIFDRLEPVKPPYGWRKSAGEQATLSFYQELNNGFILGVGKDMKVLSVLEQAMGKTALWSVAVVLTLGAAGGLILSRRTLSRLDAINRAAKDIGAGKLAQRIPSRNSGDELDVLCLTLNQMFDRIEHLVTNVRQVSTGIAHDLRTPLARLRNRLETLRDSGTAVSPEQLEEAVAEVDNILGVFAALLRLSEVEAGSLKAGFQTIALDSLVLEIAEAYRPVVEDGGHSLKLETIDKVTLVGDANLLQQLLANLLENALEHGGNPSELTLELRKSGAEIVLSVADKGAGVPLEDRAHITKPFHRLASSSGTGMGLALVAAIAELHGGQLQFLDNTPGLRCELRFPVAQ